MSAEASPPARPVGITVCVCTLHRPDLVRRTLEGIVAQAEPAVFDLSIVVVDNDAGESARPVVSDFASRSVFPVTYCVEPERNIAKARNRALAAATSEFVALIDDDEFPGPDWLNRLLELGRQEGVAGVLGPVRPHFDAPPPQWILRGKFCDRPGHPTGHVLTWRQTRTGNALIRRSLVEGVDEPFCVAYGNGGEDQDFFRRMMDQGHTFIWCDEAVVYEVVPPQRWKRRYMLKRALLRGQNERYLLNSRSVCKSLVAVPIYLMLLPFLAIAGHHHFMRYLVSLTDHVGKLMALAGWRPLGDKYLSG